MEELEEPSTKNEETNLEEENGKTVEEELNKYVEKQLVKNHKSKREIVDELVKKGISESEANSIVDNIHAEIMQIKKRNNIVQIITGGALLFVVYLITASSGDMIGSIKVFLLAGASLIIGLFGLLGNLLTQSKRSRILTIVGLLVLVAITVRAVVLHKSSTEKMEDFPDEEETVTIVPLSGDETFTVNGYSFTMKPVEGGTFEMGSNDEDAKDDEKYIHSVTVNSFYMSETEVTQGLWKAVMGDNLSVNKGKNFPVDNISWDDCQEFIQKLNQLTGKTFRLPTEAEWEYAARGGKHQSSYKYSGSDSINDVAWYEKTTNSKGTRPVKTKQPNALGLYDMSGNVWEMCSDMYGNYSEHAPINPNGSFIGIYRVLRGGGCYAYAEECRVTNRRNNEIESFPKSDGFRLVLEP